MRFTPAVFLGWADTVEAVCRQYRLPEDEIAFKAALAKAEEAAVVIPYDPTMVSVIFVQSTVDGVAVFLGMLEGQAETAEEAIAFLDGKVDPEETIFSFTSTPRKPGGRA